MMGESISVSTPYTGKEKSKERTELKNGAPLRAVVLDLFHCVPFT